METVEHNAREQMLAIPKTEFRGASSAGWNSEISVYDEGVYSGVDCFYRFSLMLFEQASCALSVYSMWKLL
jgi:hypothetical protein